MIQRYIQSSAVFTMHETETRLEGKVIQEIKQKHRFMTRRRSI